MVRTSRIAAFSTTTVLEANFALSLNIVGVCVKGEPQIAAHSAHSDRGHKTRFKSLYLENVLADVPVSTPQTHVAQLEATIRSAHALLQAGLIDEATSLLAAFSTEVQPKIRLCYLVTVSFQFFFPKKS